MSDRAPLDAASLEAFLCRRLPGTVIAVSDVKPLSGGYSCVTTTFTATIDGVARRLLARADSDANEAVTATSRGDEWKLLSALTKFGSAPMPAALYADEDGSELGAPTIILEFAAGGSFLAELRGQPESEHTKQALRMCDLVAAVHAVPLDALPDELERPGDWDAYLDGLIASWRTTEAERSNSNPVLRYMASWLDVNRPPAAPMTLVHGEFQPSNQVVDGDGNLLAIDWEFAHVGDPREDIGWCKWVEAVQPPTLIGLDDAAFCEHYRERTGLDAQLVNPLTVAYFSILPSMRVFAGVLAAQEAFADGENSSVRNGYLVGAVVGAYEGWFNAAQQIEEAIAAMDAAPTPEPQETPA